MVAAGVLISTMDSSMINVALPSIMRSFSTSLPATQLVVLVYLSTITITLVVWGHLADIYGRGKIFLLGILIFSGAALGCFGAGSLGQLVAWRSLQGAGAAMMMSSGPAIIKMVFPPDQLGRGLGLVGLATSCGLMSGPVVSGLLIQYVSWRGIFLVTLPLSLAMFGVGRFYLRLNQDVPAARLTRRYDWKGFFLWAVAIFLFVSLISFYELMPLQIIALICICLLFVLAAFVLVEREVEDPLIPSILFRRRYFSTATITAALSFAVLFIVILLIPFFLDYILKLPADRIGLVMLALPSSLVIVSPLAGWLYDHIGARILTTSGLAVCCLAILSMAGFDTQTPLIEIFFKLSLLGAGQAIFLSPNSASILSRVEERYTGVASGILATARNLGMLVGVGLAGSVFSLFFARYSGGGSLHTFQAEHVSHFLLALQWTFYLAASLSAAGCVLSSLRNS
ncbi:MFS transporter [Desulfoprunum benzoelyticum]|nr:MFS transporter [Desulfoprunum benzoelyticum]